MVNSAKAPGISKPPGFEVSARTFIERVVASICGSVAYILAVTDCFNPAMVNSTAIPLFKSGAYFSGTLNSTFTGSFWTSVEIISPVETQAPSLTNLSPIVPLKGASILDFLIFELVRAISASSSSSFVSDAS